MEENKNAIPETDSPIDSANKAAERLEVANRKKEELLVREEKNEARRMLAGKTNAGEQPVAPKEETALEYKNRIMAGDGKYGRDDD